MQNFTFHDKAFLCGEYKTSHLLQKLIKI